MSNLEQDIINALVRDIHKVHVEVLTDESASHEVVMVLLHLIDSAVDQGAQYDDLSIIIERAYAITKRYLSLGWQMKFHDSLPEWFSFTVPAQRDFVAEDTTGEYAHLLAKVA